MSDTDQNKNPEHCRPVYVVQEPCANDDEIDLLDLVAVLWRRRWFMIFFTLATTVLGVVYALSQPPYYLARTLIAPGIAGFDPQSGNPQYLPTLAEMKDWLDQKAYLAELMTQKVPDELGDKIDSMEVKAELPKGAQMLSVSVQSSSLEEGRSFLSLILSALEKDSRNLVIGRQELSKSIATLEQVLNNWDMKENRLKDDILALKRQANVVKSQMAALEKDIHTQQEAILRVEKQIEAVNLNSQDLMRQRDEMLKDRKTNGNDLALLMYTNTIQQNISYASNLEQRLDTLKTGLNERSVQLNQIQTRLKDLESSILDKEINQTRELALSKNEQTRELDILKTRLTQLCPVTVVQPPMASLEPVKPQKAMIVALAAVGGGFMSIFLAFILEFWIKNRERITGSAR
ncbi:MAG: hypothetical protein EOM25_12110 [Deltaproteobacteria bacterium]|nr:hypothetical protein [Deltaproteobacteria bacterium]